MKQYLFEYGSSFYNTEELKYFAEKYIKKLPKDVTCLVSIGSSGCAIASAILTLSEKSLNHISLRKNATESQHAAYYAGRAKPLGVYCIVDDFIDTGETIKNILNKHITFEKNIKYILVDYSELSKKRLKEIIIQNIKLITIS
jgi:adenine/guanine phosphoribosyltransferase-like PRPP-binding protein